MDTLFDLPEEPGKKFMEPIITKAERTARINKALAQDPPVSHLVSNNHPETSVKAALKVRPKLRGIKKKMLELLEAHPEGLTIFQMIEMTGIKYNSISPRPSELMDKGWIYVAGQGRSDDGNPANIYKLTEKYYLTE